MIISEAIIGSIYPYVVDEALIEKTCIDLEIDRDSEYTLADRENVAKAAIYILQNLISLASESKDGSSMSYDVNSLKERIFNIASINGLKDIAAQANPYSRITDKTNMW